MEKMLYALVGLLVVVIAVLAFFIMPTYFAKQDEQQAASMIVPPDPTPWENPIPVAEPSGPTPAEVLAQQTAVTEAERTEQIRAQLERMSLMARSLEKQHGRIVAWQHTLDELGMRAAAEPPTAAPAGGLTPEETAELARQLTALQQRMAAVRTAVDAAQAAGAAAPAASAGAPDNAALAALNERLTGLETELGQLTALAAQLETKTVSSSSNWREQPAR